MELKNYDDYKKLRDMYVSCWERDQKDAYMMIKEYGQKFIGLLTGEVFTGERFVHDDEVIPGMHGGIFCPGGETVTVRGSFNNDPLIAFNGNTEKSEYYSDYLVDYKFSLGFQELKWVGPLSPETMIEAKKRLEREVMQSFPFEAEWSWSERCFRKDGGVEFQYALFIVNPDGEAEQVGYLWIPPAFPDMYSVMRNWNASMIVREKVNCVGWRAVWVDFTNDESGIEVESYYKPKQ